MLEQQELRHTWLPLVYHAPRACRTYMFVLVKSCAQHDGKDCVMYCLCLLLAQTVTRGCRQNLSYRRMLV